MKLKELAVGSKVADSLYNETFLVAGQNHYGSGCTTIISDYVVSSKPIDAPEPDNPIEIRAKNGSNNYSESNIHQWLNSDTANWFKPLSPYDCPPKEMTEEDRHIPTPHGEIYIEEPLSINLPGFLVRFSSEFKACLKEQEIPCVYSEKEGEPRLSSMKAGVFLPSTQELGLSYFRKPDSVIEGKSFDAFRINPRLEHADNRYWSRTPAEPDVGDNAVNPAAWDEIVSDLFYNVGFMYPGYVASFANDYSGVRPCINLDSDAFVSDSPDKYGVYTLLGYSADREVEVPEERPVHTTIEHSIRVPTKDMEHNPNGCCFFKNCTARGFCKVCFQAHPPDHACVCRRDPVERDPSGCGIIGYSPDSKIGHSRRE